MATHHLTADQTHSRWCRDFVPRLWIRSGDIVEFECLDSTGGQVRETFTAEELARIDRDRVHALTGPVYVEGAQPGDVLEAEILEVSIAGWGWTGIFPGRGFLTDRFTEPFLFIWEFEGDATRSLPPAVVPLQPFCGVLGVAPDFPGEFRTWPPGRFGGNMDVRQLTAGARLFLPVLNPGALFSAGDMHAAQGDGEVCVTAIECSGRATIRFTLHKHQSLDAPFLRSPTPRVEAGPEWIFVESDTDPMVAARHATERMVDFAAELWGLTAEHAYVLCSVAMHLRLSQVVNVPLVTATAAMPCGILPDLPDTARLLQAIRPLAR